MFLEFTPRHAGNGNAIASIATTIENVLRDHPDGLIGSERWIAPPASSSR